MSKWRKAFNRRLSDGVIHPALCIINQGRLKTESLFVENKTDTGSLGKEGAALTSSSLLVGMVFGNLFLGFEVSLSSLLVVCFDRLLPGTVGVDGSAWSFLDWSCGSFLFFINGSGL